MTATITPGSTPSTHAGPAATLATTASLAASATATLSTTALARGRARLRGVGSRALSGWRRELAFVAVLYLVYDASRLLPGATLHSAVRNGQHILSAERWAHLDPERWLNDHLVRLPVLPPIAALAYESLHYLVTPTVLIWLYLRRSEHYRRARNWIAAMTFLGLAGFISFPAAPPRMLPGEHFHDVVAEQHHWGWWSAHGEAPQGLGSFVNEFAAMPSLHVGWAAWAGWLIFRNARHRTVRYLGLAYPVITVLIVLSTANHYLFDALAGLAVAGIGWLLAERLDHLRGRRTRDEVRDNPEAAAHPASVR